MELFFIRRQRVNDEHDQVCVGASPLSGVPYWADTEVVMRSDKGGIEPTDSVIQPLMFRRKEYAQWCLDIAKREELKAHPGEDNVWTYHVGTANFDMM